MPESRRPRATLIALLVIVFVGAAIRITVSTLPRLNLDEGWAIYLGANPIGDVIWNLQRDRHPPLPYLMLKGLLAIGGHDEWRLRLPFAIVGSINALLAFVLGRRLFGAAAGLGGAALTAVSFIAWEYDTWMRGYVLLTFFSLLSTICFVRVATGGSRRWTFAYATSGALLLYTHYLGLLALGAHVALALLPDASNTWLPVGQRVRRALPAWLAMGVLFLPWVPMMRLQATRRAARGDLDVAGQPLLALITALRVLPLQTGLDNLPLLFRDALGDRLETVRLWWAGLATALCATAAWVGARRLRQHALGLRLLVLLMLPVALLIVLIGVKAPELSRIRYYAPYVPYLGMLAGAAVAARPRLFGALAAVVIAVNVAVFASYVQTPYFRSSDWKTPAAFVTARQSQAQIIVGYRNDMLYAFDYYYAGDELRYDVRDIDHPAYVHSARYRERGGLPEVRLWPQEFPEKLDEQLRGVDTAVLILWLDAATPAVRDWFRDRFDVVDGVIVDNFEDDGRSMTFLLRRKPTPR